METKTEMTKGVSPETVCIDKDRFAELVRKEAALEILQRAYLDLDSYQLDAVLPVLLGSKKGDGDAEQDHHDRLVQD